MSDTSEAAVKRFRQETPVVDAVCLRLEREAGADEAARIVEFAEIFLSKAPPDFLAERSEEALAHTVRGAFRFLQRARPDRVDVEIVNPDLETEGWSAPVTVISTNVSERPFIVDTIREFLHAHELPIEHNIYPVLRVERDAEGKVLSIRPSREGGSRESIVHCEVARVSDPSLLDYLRGELAGWLGDVVRATDDFRPMVDALNDVLDELLVRAEQLPERRRELEEVRAFLGWLREGAFVFLGSRAYDLIEMPDGERAVVVEPGSGLGILRNEGESSFADPVPLSSFEGGLRDLVVGGPSLIISKTNARATVHRRARMDYIGVKKLDETGRVVGEHRFMGLFTSRAYAEEAEKIPILREKLHRILEDAGVSEGSHDYKEINTIFNSMPKEELFVTSAPEIGADVRTVLTSYHTVGVRVTLRQDPLHRGVSVLVILPKDKFSGDVRKAIESALVHAFQGEVLNYHLALGEGDQARLHFYLAAPGERLRVVRAGDLERTVQGLIRSWPDRLREGLESVRPPDDARRLARRYGEAFSPEYRAATDPAVAAEDILELEAMLAEDRAVSITVANRGALSVAPGTEQATELKLYLRGRRLILSDFMPILENAGLRVIAVSPFEVDGPGVGRALIYTFAVQDSQGEPLDVGAKGELLAETILAVWRGDVGNDSLNALVLAAGLHWREVDVLRAYAAYAFQLGAVPSRLSLPSALRRHPHIARVLFELFEVRFDPARPASLEQRSGATEDVRALLNEALKSVSLLADDRALRRLSTLIAGTVRTNYYRSGGREPTRRSGGVPYTSFKFACRELDSITRSRLLFEVWVRSSRMEGVHLRGAKVARGGIRWSERQDDFRTEVLGLVKTQMVKNAVIVPAGSKGGFVTLRHLPHPEQVAEDGVEQYKTLIRGLLDVTDNLDARGSLTHPEDVLSFDDPDPYLVVAADKGTAKFSDIANAVAAEYDFWLGDAFASGGSRGYDHKAVGITARGAWECVKRHFREKRKDIQAEPFTVVGIGDMSGDVFGNGMLLSRKIRLLAAFDHRHVFIDPTPDEEVSFRERERLFRMGRSSWDDYDRSLLSPGGLIIRRGAKEVQLAPEALAALGLPEDAITLDGEGLVRAVLRAPAELLWNGGIGTYVKSADETHSDAGDPPNDAVRVDASELRCEVVGEGGNLGFTQLARIEYALRGGRINTDALDNSGGVDLSDREVNLKILLNAPVRAGRMAEERRNELLVELTDAVAELVVRDSHSQSRAISLDEIRARSPESTEDFRDLMSSLEKAGMLDRAAESLPTLEALQERHEEGGSLTRPELCVLLAYAKLSLMSEILKSSLPDDPATESYLLGYFPPAALVEAGQEALHGHRLRREIIASQLTNDLIDLMGATFVHRQVRSTGRPGHEVVRAWLVAARLAGHRSLLKQMVAQVAGTDLQAAYRWLLGLARVLQRTARWVLQNVPPEVPTAQSIGDKLEGLAMLRQHFSSIVTGDDRAMFEKLVGEIRELGAEEEFAQSLISLRFLDHLLEILRVSSETGADPLDTARAFYKISDLLRVPWLRQAVFDSAEEDRWEQRAAQALADDLTRAHHRVVVEVMRARRNGTDIDDVANRLISSSEREVTRFRLLLEEIQQEPVMTLSGLSVAVREITVLSERLNGVPA